MKDRLLSTEMVNVVRMVMTAEKAYNRINSLKRVFATFILFLSLTAFGQPELPNSTVTIIQLIEHEYYQQREEQLISLNPELLKKGNWSEDDLKQFARHLPYETYVNQIAELKNDIESIGIQNVLVMGTNEQANSTFTIIHSFEAEIYRGGGIGLMIHLNLYEGKNPIIIETHWKKVKRELKNWLKNVDNITYE